MKRLLAAIAIFACTIASAQDYGVVNISVCNMRDVPQYSAEMVSQAIMGTPVKILQRGGEYNWPEVQTPDTYTGWVHKDAIAYMSAEELHEWNAAPKVVVTALWSVVKNGKETVCDVVAGSRLKYIGKKGCSYKVALPDGRTGLISKADADLEKDWRKNIDKSADAIIATALSMNGFPYIWAGMSPKGMDCSGYVRAVLFMHDIIIPRDAGPQSRTGQRINDKDALQPGDLVFFGRWDGETPRVSHVGIYMGEGRFIHSLGLVKIGSFNADDPLYDAYNTGRYLFGSRIIPFTDPQYSTTETNPLYTM